MNIYLLSRKDDVGYDEYDSFVIASNSAEEAIRYDPSGRKIEAFGGKLGYWYENEFSNEKRFWEYGEWGSWPVINRESIVEITIVGTTDKYTEPTVICASFNAG
jgi:hypothetical protein